jgi:hypothetical protein
MLGSWPARPAPPAARRGRPPGPLERHGGPGYDKQRRRRRPSDPEEEATDSTRTRSALTSAAALAAALWGATGFEGVVGGQVKDAHGAAIAGAMITVSDARPGLAESVFSARDGRFTLNTRLSGALDLRARKPYFADHTGKIELGASGRVDLAIGLAPLQTDAEISDSSPSISHFAKITFDNEGAYSRPQFARDCLPCHHPGNSLTRWARPPEGWLPSVTRMHGYLGNGDAAAMKRRAEMLAKGFDGTAARSRPTYPVDPALYRARILQFRFDAAGVPHDAEVSRIDGKVYTVDMFVDAAIVTDLATGLSESVPETADGLPPGGAFAKMGAPAPYGLTIIRAPHSLAHGLDTKFYFTKAGWACTANNPIPAAALEGQTPGLICIGPGDSGAPASRTHAQTGTRTCEGMPCRRRGSGEPWT